MSDTNTALEKMIGQLDAFGSTIERVNTSAMAKGQILDIRSWMLEKGKGTNLPKAA